MTKKFLVILANFVACSFSQIVFAMTHVGICTQTFGENEDPSLLNVWMTPDESRALVAYENPHNNPFLKRTYKLQCNRANLMKENAQTTCSMPADHPDTGGLNISFHRDTQNKMMLIFEAGLLDEEGNLFYETDQIDCTALSETKRRPLHQP